MLQQGPAFFARTLADMTAWLEEKGYASVGQLRGCMSQRAVPDSTAFVRGELHQDARELRESGVVSAEAALNQCRETSRLVSR